MKPSEAMLKGFAMAGGVQCFKNYCEGNPLEPDAVCAAGAWCLGENGNANNHHEQFKVSGIFREATGSSIFIANDNGMSIPDIAGILASEGY